MPVRYSSGGQRAATAYIARRSAAFTPSRGPTTVPVPSPHAAATSWWFTPGQHRGGLDRRAQGDGLDALGHHHRPFGEVGQSLPVRAGRAPPPTSEDAAAGSDSGTAERVEPVEQAAHDTLEGGPGEVLTGGSVRRPVTGRSRPGRFGVRSPSKYGTSTTPPRARRRGEGERASPAGSTPSQRATASVTFVAFSVQTSGRKRPVASANPATAPVGSAVGVSLTA